MLLKEANSPSQLKKAAQLLFLTSVKSQSTDNPYGYTNTNSSVSKSKQALLLPSSLLPYLIFVYDALTEYDNKCHFFLSGSRIKKDGN